MVSLEDFLRKKKLTEEEAQRIISSVENKAPQQHVSFEDYFENRVKFGVVSDTHIGHKEFDVPFWKQMCGVMRRNGVSRIYHVGDILEGMSGREGHIYELSEIGFQNQLDKAIEMFKLLRGIQIFGITGNHDDWYMKKNNGGVDVGLELQRAVRRYHHLGSMEANVDIGDGLTMKLFHPNDGTAYATSYKLQKLIESFTGGEKPAVVMEGHYHKAMYMFCRNVHGLEAGTMAGQTPFMRGKKIPAHKGFWIVDIEKGRGGIGKFAPEFYPGYK